MTDSTLVKIALSSILCLIVVAAAAYFVTADTPSTSASAASSAAATEVTQRTGGELESIGGLSPEVLAAEAATLAGRSRAPIARREREVEVYRRELHAYLGDLRKVDFPGSMHACKPQVRRILGEIGAAVGGSLPFLHGHREALIYVYFGRAEGLIHELSRRLRNTLAATTGMGNAGCTAAVAPPLI
jgi:hypothetical protein